MTEAELLQEIHGLADGLNLMLFHCRDSRGSLGRGFPDLVIAGRAGTVFAELKTNGTSLTPDQRRWGSTLSAGGECWYVWRPRDLQSGVIEKTLASLAIRNGVTPWS